MRYCRHILTILSVSVMLACSPGEEQASPNSSKWENPEIVYPQNLDSLDAKGLALAYCQGCHLFPEPDLLPKQIWERGVLPRMAQRLGVSGSRNPYLGMSYAESLNAVKSGAYSGIPLISDSAWQKIVDYYIENAPDSSLAYSGDILPVMDTFAIQSKAWDYRRNKLPGVTMVQYSKTFDAFWIGQRVSQLDLVSREGKVIYSANLPSPPVKLIEDDEKNFYVLTTGNFDPSDLPEGLLLKSSLQKTDWDFDTVFSSLMRPVDMIKTDLNQDGKLDWLICQFGNLTGKLSWFESVADNNYREHILISSPGAVRVKIHDWDNDGLPDITALMAQGDESLITWYNLGSGKFSPVRLLRFSPISGSNDFELLDWDNDGDTDILYSNGDNADYSFSLKRYHGIHIFSNVGKDQFEEVFFYPFHGSSGLATGDYDNDGDLDIAAISFFADHEHQPLSGFVMLERNNSDSLSFTPHQIPSLDQGRWIRIESVQFEGEEVPRIFLGSFALGPTPVPNQLRQKWINNAVNVMELTPGK